MDRTGGGEVEVAARGGGDPRYDAAVFLARIRTEKECS